MKMSLDSSDTAFPQALPAGLYVVATPIGNSRDITLRALEVLQKAAAIACEDTRRTGQLLAAHGFKTPLLRYDDATGEQTRPLLLERLQAGEAIALVSDAGTPLVADPGYKLVRAALAIGLNVIPIPGVCAAIAALSAAGLPSDAFYFAGFLSRRSPARQAALTQLKIHSATLIFYEAGNRLQEFLQDAAAVFGARPVVVAREISKTHESFYRGTLGELVPACTLGECVVLIGGALADADTAAWQQALAVLLEQGISARDAAAAIAAAFKVSKRDVYQHALQL